MLKNRSLYQRVSLSFVVLSGLVYATPSSINIPTTPTSKKSNSTTVQSAASNLNITAPQYKPNQVIVKYKKSVDMAQLSSSVKSLGLDIEKRYDALSKATGHLYTVVKSKSLSTEALIKQLEADPNVVYAEPDYIYHSNTTPNDPFYADYLWGQNNTAQTINGTQGTVDADMDAPEAWSKTTGSEDVVIAVIDTGVDYLHEDLAANMWTNPGEIPGNGIDDDGNGYVDDVYGINAVGAGNGTGDPMDKLIEDGGHGTHVAGTIAAVGNNGRGVVGVSWKSKIMALKFLSIGGGASSDAVECLNYVLAQKNAGVNIVASNNSWGGGSYSSAIRDAIQANNDAGVLFIAAAGNGGSDQIGDDNDATPHYPSSYDLPGIIAVAATDQDDNLASFSNYGATSVDIAAPGTNILSSVPRTYTASSSNIFFDDMESGLSQWITGGTNNSWAISTDQERFAKDEFPVPSPTHFLSDSPGTNYANNTDSWIMMKNDLDLSSYSEDIYIAFGAAILMEQDGSGTIYDHALVQVSGDSGTNWTTLFDMAVFGRYWLNPYNLKVPDAVKTAHFRLRFHIKSDNSVNEAGWLIDNVGIGTSSDAMNAYGFKSGTSMATPQVSGAIALRASECRSDNADNLKADLFSTVDLKSSVTGKVLTEGRLNVNTLINKACAVEEGINMTPIYYLLN